MKTANIAITDEFLSSVLCFHGSWRIVSILRDGEAGTIHIRVRGDSIPCPDGGELKGKLHIPKCGIGATWRQDQ